MSSLPSLEMLDICKLNVCGSNLMRYQVCITTDRPDNHIPTVSAVGGGQRAGQESFESAAT